MARHQLSLSSVGNRWRLSSQETVGKEAIQEVMPGKVEKNTLRMLLSISSK
jgi:hypothetical protein